MIDFTSVANAAATFLLSVAGTVFLAWLSSHMKDKQAAAVIGTAVTNALGAVKQASDAGLASHPLQAQLPGITPAMAAGVQYVLDNAAPELKRYTGITPAVIAGKIDAKFGSAKIATNLAVSASASPAVLPPLAPTPAVPA
jgi:hypothetical protein